MAKLIVSPSPHFQNKTTTQVLMNDVLIALAPATLVSLLFYGWNALLLLLVCVATCVGCEYLIEKYLRGREIPCISATAVTGVLLALNLPPAAPWWVAFVGSIAAIGIAKMCFGGLGQNIFNPAILAMAYSSFVYSKGEVSKQSSFMGCGAFFGYMHVDPKNRSF